MLERLSANHSFLVHRYQIGRVEDSDFDAEVLVLGDSSMRSCIDPRIVESDGVSVANLATLMATGLAGDYYLLRSYLELHPAPRAVLIGHTPGALSGDFSRKLFQEHHVEPLEALRLHREGFLTAMELIEAQLHWVLPTYRYRTNWKAVLHPLLIGDFEAFRKGRTMNVRFWLERARLGYIPNDEPDKFPEPSRDGEVKWSRSNEYFLERIIELTSAEDTRLWFLPGPVVEGSDTSQPWRWVTDVKRRADLIRPQALHVLVDRPLTVPAPKMADRIHCTSRGATEVSHKLKVILSRQLR